MALPLLCRTVLPLLLPFLQSYLEWSREAPRRLTDREARLRAFYEAVCQILLAEDAKADELQVRPGICSCGGRFQSKGQRKRTLATTVGEVSYRRRYYECERCQAHCLPVDEAWGVERGLLSPAAKILGVDLCSALPFGEARWWLERLGGISVSRSTLWRVTQAAGAARVAAWEAEQQKRESRKGAAAFVRALRGAGAPGRWAIGVDGLFLRISHEWHEVKVAVVGRLTETGEWVKGETSYVASRVSAKVFRHLLVHHALSRGITRQSVLAILSDGAAWIEALSRRHFPQAVVIRDWWHAVGYLWQGAHALYGEGTQKADHFATALKTLLWDGQIQQVREQFEQKRQTQPIQGQERQEAYRRALGYLERHQEAMHYPDYREANWPVGSGPAEATCKMIQARMKRSGMNWSEKGAEHLLFLRAEYCSRLNANLYPHL